MKSNARLPLPAAPPVSAEIIAQLQRDIADLFTVEDVTLDSPKPGYVRWRGQLLGDLATHFDDLRGRFERRGFTPRVRREKGQIVLTAMPVVFAETRPNWVVNLVLFLVTILSTLYIGASYEPQFSGTELWLGWRYSLSLLLILGAHEMGHYLAARYHQVPVTLPYFIPLPFSSIGTLGAFIMLKAPVKNRRALLDVGAAGPLAGLLVALPILLYGLSISEVGPLPPAGGYLLEGNSLLYLLIKFALFGRILPANGIDVTLDSVAWAGWLGLLVTGLNLLPVGQLDGGHAAYVLFGERARRFFWPVILALIALALFANALTWGVWVALLFLIGNRHAEPLDDVTPLDGKRRFVAILTLVIFVLVFTPIPLRVVPPA
ncbi:MAG: site-2 protease family protein [Chloroflexota bacterium]